MRRTARTLLVPAGLLLLVACGGDDRGPDRAQGCPPVRAVDDTAAIPEGIPLDEFGTVRRVREQDKFVIAEAIAERPIPELFRAVLDTLRKNHSILSQDNEGFEAEIFFADVQGRTGLIQLRQTACPDQTLVRLTFG